MLDPRGEEKPLAELARLIARFLDGLEDTIRNRQYRREFERFANRIDGEGKGK